MHSGVTGPKTEAGKRRSRPNAVGHGWPPKPSLSLWKTSKTFGAIGYGIQFGPNVFHVFDSIGVSDALLQKADSPPAVLMIDALTGNG